MNGVAEPAKAVRSLYIEQETTSNKHPTMRYSRGSALRPTALGGTR